MVYKSYERVKLYPYDYEMLRDLVRVWNEKLEMSEEDMYKALFKIAARYGYEIDTTIKKISRAMSWECQKPSNNIVSLDEKI